MTPGAIVCTFFKILNEMTNTAASRSEQRVIDPLVEMAQLLSKPFTHRSVTRIKINLLACTEFLTSVCLRIVFLESPCRIDYPCQTSG